MNEDIVIYDYTIRIGNKILYDVNEDIIKLLRQLQQENQQLKDRINKAIKIIEDDYYSLNTVDINRIVVSGNKLIKVREILKGGNNGR